MMPSHRSSGVSSRLWMMLDRVATLAVIAAAAAFLWNGGLSRFWSPAAPTGQPEIPIPKESVAMDGAQKMGSPTARVVLMEFSDFQCPFCSRFAKETLPGLKAKYIDTGLVQFAFRHHPLPNHANAQAAAVAAECAGRQDAFWKMHDRLFEDPAKLEESHIIGYASQLGLDLAVFNRCRAQDAPASVLRDAELASALALRGTPVFFVGSLGPDGTLEVRNVIAGARPAGEFEVAIDGLVNKAS